MIYRMTISEARFGMSAVEQDVEIIAPGIGRTSCWECEGEGDWAKFHPEPELFPEGLPCVNCKGQGWRLVDAWALPKRMTLPLR
jgi:hypothetical protein